MLVVGVFAIVFVAIDSDSARKSVMDLIGEWVPKISVAICAVGLIELAFRFKNDLHSKNRH